MAHLRCEGLIDRAISAVTSPGSPRLMEAGWRPISLDTQLDGWDPAGMGDDPDPRRELRSAVSRGDGLRLLRILFEGPWVDQLQLAGDGILLAFAQNIEGAPEAARSCATRLRARGWEGDDILADQLEIALGMAPDPRLRLVPVDLEEFSDVLEGDGAFGPGGIDVVTGQVWPGPALDYAQETGQELPDLEDPERWLYVECEGSHAGYGDMEQFIANVTDAGQADRLSIAITGRGAFRRFKDVLARWPDDLERWFVFSGERRRGRARAWLAEAGIVAMPGRTSSPT